MYNATVGTPKQAHSSVTVPVEAIAMVAALDFGARARAMVAWLNVSAASGKLFARKFDVDRDAEILDLIDQELLSPPSREGVAPVV